MRSAWWVGDLPVTQPYGCTDFLAEGPSPFHPECAAFHDGIDIGLDCGADVIAAASGVVRQVGVFGGGPFALIINIGNWDVWLFHLQAAFVSVGEQVLPGMVLGNVGTLGFSTGCHLHFEVTTAGGGYRDSIDPLPFLPAQHPPVGVAWPQLPLPADSPWRHWRLLMDYSLKLALVDLMYFAVLGRGVGDQPEADQWAQQIGDNGENAWQILQTIAASPEARAYATPAARIKALQDALSKLPSAAVGAHTHSVSLAGNTGQPVT